MAKQSVNWAIYLIVFLSILAIIVLIYRKLKEGQSSGDPNPWIDPDPDPGPDPDPVDGFPQFWNMQKTNVYPANNIIWDLPFPAHVVVLSGHFELMDINPSAWFKKAVGLSVYAISSSGTKYLIQQIHPNGGLRSGIHPFEGTVGQNDIRSIEIKIDWYYGLGDKVYKISEMSGEITVIA